MLAQWKNERQNEKNERQNAKNERQNAKNKRMQRDYENAQRRAASARVKPNPRAVPCKITHANVHKQKNSARLGIEPGTSRLVAYSSLL